MDGKNMKYRLHTTPYQTLIDPESRERVADVSPLPRTLIVRQTMLDSDHARELGQRLIAWADTGSMELKEEE